MAQSGKTYLHKREFLTKNKSDGSYTSAEVRRYEYGGMNASFTLAGNGREVYTIYCSPDSAESVADANAEIDTLMERLEEYKTALNKAAKEAPKLEVNMPTSSRK